MASARKLRYHVFVDESEAHDDKLLVLGAVLIREDHLAGINRDMNALRETIGRKMRREKYPVYFGDPHSFKRSPMRTEAVRLRAGGLPEIHAKDMWQSQHAYECPRSPESLARRNEWIHRVTRIFQNHQVLFIARNFQGKFRTFAGTKAEHFFDVFGDHLTPDQSRKEVEKLLEDVHFAITFELFIYLNSLMEVGIEICSVTCDRGKRSELFGKFDGFDRAREYDYWQNFPNPIFEDSFDSNGLQLADFMVYFYTKTFYGHHHNPPRPERQVISRISHCLITPVTSTGAATRDASGVPTERESRLMVAMQVEAALLHCGGQRITEPDRQASAAVLTRIILSGSDLMTEIMAMNEAGIASYTGPVEVKDSISSNDPQGRGEN
ncbi:DUF3800 domain-containing protein [Deinococcus sp. D7000]|nr:DUF3800 domain-containing protein [Deinococcus sp. D7000]